MNIQSILSLLIAAILFALIPQSVANAQWASNASRDLFGENLGDFIILQWTGENAAADYVVYEADSRNGPWIVSFSVADMRGGAKVVRTPDARVKDLCFKVEATDATKKVIRIYQPICVPKFVS
jgi:hypothetical protein